MELGAMICKPKNPECSKCPISKNCKSYKKKDFDLAKITKKNKEKYFILKVYKKNQKYLLVKNTRFNFLKNFHSIINCVIFFTIEVLFNDFLLFC